MHRAELNEIIEVISKSLAEIGLECIDVEWEQKDRILRLYIDRPDGVVIDDCVTATRHLEDLPYLDERIDGTYNLEVSSPGVERPLRTIEHFEAQVGKTVEAVLIERHGDRKHGVGVIKEVQRDPDQQVLLETNRGDWWFPIEKLNSCKLKFDWQS